MIKVLILGGTGAMGKHLVKLFMNSNIQVYVTSRKPYRNLNNIFYIQGNAHNIDFLYQILQEKFDVIVDFMSYTTFEFKDRVSLFLNSCKQYIFLSSSRVYSDVDTVITEETPRLLDICKDTVYLNSDEYAIAKARQEDLLKLSGKENWTIIRPYITYSEIRLQLGADEKEDWLYRVLKNRTIVFSKDIASKYTTLTYGEDVSKGIYSIIGKEEAYGQAFHITSEKPILWSDVLTNYLDTIEHENHIRPEVLLRERSSYLCLPYNFYQVKYDRLYNRKFDNSKIKKFVDISTFVNPQEGLRNCLKVFLQEPKFKSIYWKKQAMYDTWTHEFANLSEPETFKQTLKYILYRLLFFGNK